jgi:CO/xanthine dehydrogenase FAD-binding subunit
VRSPLPDFSLVTPKTLAEALAIVAKEPGVWTLIAGGTDLMVHLASGTMKARRLLNLWGLRELIGFEVTPEHVTLGALTTYTAVRQHPVIQAEFPSLVVAAAETGGLAIQNRGTLGGNVANASPAADSPPALLAYDAAVRLSSAGGERWLPIGEFYLGYKKLAMRPDELISGLRLPRVKTPALWRHWYRKVGPRKAQAISKVVISATVRLESPAAGAKIAEARFAIGSVAPTVKRCSGVEAALVGKTPSAALADQVAARVLQDIAPIDDLRSTAAYRRTVAANLARRFVLDLGAAPTP